MRNEICTFTESCTLPSLGRVYDREVKSVITLRSMTTAEEMRRLSPAEHSYENMCGIIDDCTKDYSGISSYDMCIADYTALLYKLRTVTYGPEYTITSECPLCHAFNEGIINLDELGVTFYNDDCEKYREFKLPVSKHTVKIRFQTPRILDITQDKIKEFKRKTQDKSLDTTLLFTLESVIESVDGQKLDPISAPDWLRSLQMKDTNTIWQYSEKLEQTIGVDRILPSVCDVCQFEYDTKISMNRKFFRPSLDI